ncbi:carboxypeptidase-like regulatory domain-containing protein [uncultured Gimesia sp.]|uniref:carboxypeptidase-like regulatory domain-containing protein n=1 Tax=uncultured Gimesia sp. TaxID=1678688 RepID=UPI0030D8327F|tara:strand:- start:390986 stop:391405 length:420 start_codon:yes stop_codon:yes gene_type:complete
MMRAPHFSSVVMILLGSILWVGCGGGKDPDLPETVSAAGIVTYQGKPVPEATIMFYPVQGRKPGSGKSDASGKFTLTTFSKNDGVIPGDHKVTINAYESTPQGVSMKSSIPEKYSNQKSSPLTMSVSESQPEITLELVD